MGTLERRAVCRFELVRLRRFRIEGKSPLALENDGVGEHGDGGGIDLVEEVLDAIVGVFGNPGVDRLYCRCGISEVQGLGLGFVRRLQALLERRVDGKVLLQPERVGHGKLYCGRLAYLLGEFAIGGVEGLERLRVSVQSSQDGVAGGSVGAIGGHGQRDRYAGWRDEDVSAGALRSELAQDVEAELCVGARKGAGGRGRVGFGHGATS